MLWIGWSNDPRASVANLRYVCPDSVQLVASHSAHPIQMGELHFLLRADRVRREACWFRPTPSTIGALARAGISLSLDAKKRPQPES